MTRPFMRPLPVRARLWAGGVVSYAETPVAVGKPVALCSALSAILFMLTI
jgi:hypothetical protein